MLHPAEKTAVPAQRNFKVTPFSSAPSIMDHDVSKVNASVSSVGGYTPSVVASEATPLQVESASSELENNKISFYLPSVDDQEELSEGSEHSDNNNNPSGNLVEVRERGVSDLVRGNTDFTDHTGLYDPDSASYTLMKQRNVSHETVENTKQEISASHNEKEDHVGQNTAKTNSENQTVEHSNRYVTSGTNNINAQRELSEKQNLAAKIFQTKNEPSIFVFPSLADPGTDRGVDTGAGSLMGDSTGMSDKFYGLTGDGYAEEHEVVAINAGTSYHVSMSIAKNMITSECSLQTESHKDTASITKSEKDIETGSETVSSTGIEREGSWSSQASSSSFTKSGVSEPLISGETVSSKPPDLISSLPFLPLLTPYSSEDSTAERISSSSTTERLNSANQEEVFLDDDKTQAKSDSWEEQGEGKMERQGTEKASDIHVPSDNLLTD